MLLDGAEVNIFKKLYMFKFFKTYDKYIACGQIYNFSAPFWCKPSLTSERCMRVSKKEGLRSQNLWNYNTFTKGVQALKAYIYNQQAVFAGKMINR